jgi:hypothetical protein
MGEAIFADRRDDVDEAERLMPMWLIQLFIA